MTVLRQLGWRFWLATAVGTGGAALVVGIPTDVVPNPWFQRMTAVRGLDVVLWALTSLLLGALAATYVAGSGGPRGGSAGLGSGVLGVLAVGCPICNKLVVALLGVSGALSYFAPLQPLLGAAGVLLAALALRVRLRALLHSCRVPPPVVPTQAS